MTTVQTTSERNASPSLFPLEADVHATYVFADIAWKQLFRAFMPKRHFVFVPVSTSLELFLKKENISISQEHQANFDIFFFNALPNKEFLDYAEKHNVNIQIMQPGLLNLTTDYRTKPPFSWISNQGSPLLNQSSLSSLQNTLETFNFSENPELQKRARDNIDTIIKHRLSIQNNFSPYGLENIYPVKSSRRVLVLGIPLDSKQSSRYQSDTSIIQILRIARMENMDAQIIYKPHPSVLYSKLVEARKAHLEEVSQYCDITLTTRVDIFSALNGVDHVYTIDSHAGFEALLHDIKVTTFGRPWYAGWGVTDDRQNIMLHQKRSLSIEDLFAAAYLLHSQYFDYLYRKPVTLEEAISRIIQERHVDYAAQTEAALIKQASLLAKSTDPREALEYTNYAISVCPKSIKLYTLLTNLQSRAGDFHTAVQTVNKAIELDPRNSELYLLRANTRVKTGEFSDSIEEDFYNAVNFASIDSKARLLHRVFSFIWEKSPVNEQTLNNFDFLMEQIPVTQRKGRVYGNLLLLQANLLVEVGQYATIQKLYNEAKTHGATLDKRSLALRYTARKHCNLKVASDQEMQSFQKLLSYQDRFRELVLESKGSVCIVGNAPTLLGKGLGEKIDSNQLVIRFNSYNTSYPYSEDYGVKADVWVRMIFHPYVRRQPESGLKLVMFSGSNRLYRPYTEWPSILNYVDSGIPVQFFPANDFYELQKILGAPPTSGLMLCYMLYKIIGPLKPENYYGLSFTEPQHDDVAYHYSDLNAQAGPRHDWDREAEFFKTIMADPEVNLPPPRSMHSHIQNQQSSSSAINTAETQNFDRVISCSPGLLNYSLFGRDVEYLDGKTSQRHLTWLKQGKVSARAEPSELLQSILPHQKVCFLGFGRSTTGQNAVKLAEALGMNYRLVEYGLISSMHLPSEKQFNFSLILDDQGIFYDTTAASKIHSLLLNDADIFSAELSERANSAIAQITAHNITKYNNSPNIELPQKPAGQHRILVIDQTAGDNSIIFGQCEQYSFRDMLQHALEQPNAEVVLKIHPETAAGAKEGNLTAIEDLLNHPQLHVIQEQCNIVSLIKQADEVYVMTSGVGLEALFLDKPVRCFGVPFYAGWGLTTDMVTVSAPRRPLTKQALFAAVFFKYHTFFHPVSQEPSILETCLEWIVDNQPSVTPIKMEWSV
ncbi:MAG: glycosyltransferase family 29 protein [Pseudomonadota bacterium]|nr:glycosyltransferase family 29 protein [Pseudomonadota bacterium]